MLRAIQAYIDLGCPCLFRLFTGFYCPGCGGRRAFDLLRTGHPLLSFFYHPLVLYTVLLALYSVCRILFDHLTKHRILPPFRFRNGYLWAALILLLLNWILKNAALLFGYDLMPLHFASEAAL